MRNPQSAYSYLFKNFITLLLMALAPSVVLSFSLDDKNIFTFFMEIIHKKDYTINSYFSDVYSYFTSVGHNGFFGFLLWLLGIILLIVFLGIAFSSVEKKMRLGVSTGIRWLDLLNDSVMFVLPYVAVVFVSFELFGFVCSGMIVLFFTLLESKIAFIVVSLLFTILLYAIYFVLFAYLSLTVPCMMIDGYTFRFAAGYSITLVQKDIKKILLSLLIPFAICCALIITVSAIMVFNGVSKELVSLLSSIVSFLCLCFYLMYFPVVCVKNYMSITGERRRDVWNWR